MNSKRKRYKTCIVLLAAVLAFGSALPAFAAESGGTNPPSGTTATISTGTAPEIGKVALNANSYFELKNVVMMPEQGNKTVTFTVGVHNGGTTDLQFIDYWPQLRTKTGNQISVRVLPQDKDKNRIPAKSSQDISFYVTVNESTDLKDLIFEVIKWDFSMPEAGFKRKIGEVSVPDNYSVVTPAGKAHTIQMASNPVKASIKKVLISKNEKNYTPTIVLNLENVGSKSVAVPGYQYLLRTSEGYMYPLDAKGVKDLTLNPQTNKDIDLTGSVPLSVSREGWQLVIVQDAQDLKRNLPIAFFALPAVSDKDGVDTGKAFSFTIKSGTYSTKLNTVQRLPWQDEDILTAGFTLSNKGPEALPIPDLTGYFKLDDNVKVEAKLVRTDNVIGLAPNAEAQFQLIGKIPYASQFGKVKFVLQEKTGSSGGDGKTDQQTAASDLLEFVHRSEMMNIPYNNFGETYKANNVGRSVSYKVRSVTTYPGETADTFTALLEVGNLETRVSDISKLVGYFKTAQGRYYPATISEIKSKVNPDGKALFLLSTHISRGFPTSGMNVIIGEAVTEGKLTEADKKPDAYVNAVAYWLPQENFTLKNDFKNLDLVPYQLSLSNIRTSIDNEGAKLKFNYELIKDLMITTNMDGRKLIVELDDDDQKIRFNGEFNFKDFDGEMSDKQGAANGQLDPKEKFIVGKHKDLEIKARDGDLRFKISHVKKFKLNIYDSFQGQKKLIATREVNWFEPTE
ncbi:hypothetical protein SAMN04487970_100514 [Paenibacillus tianmuensis]|uniref:Uncharacterized protein n=1 Tax=Paenibacillus tianmuensis TaxID=624147 RepID=A0A1G4Q1G2_9BACL|nr:hypothetical protein [Paenibacillus tianmuensis]SCW38440.1 hypothetical protein SAMN04487970_100514 [Paenibacillus tianmuensis]